MITLYCKELKKNSQQFKIRRESLFLVKFLYNRRKHKEEKPLNSEVLNIVVITIPQILQLNRSGSFFLQKV